MRKFVLLAAAVLGFAYVGSAAAQDATSTSYGTLVGNVGGAHMEWTASAEPNTNAMVSVTYSPCIDPDAVSLVVYSSDGQTTTAYRDGHCKKTATWNTSDSDSATIKLSNYLHGVATNYAIETSGLTVAGAAPAMDAADDEMMADDEAADADAAAAAEEEAAMSDAAETLAANADTGTVVGDAGGAYATYDVELTAGQRYAGAMVYNMDVGGQWPGVGMTIYGPDGWSYNSSHDMHRSGVTADFVAPADGTYKVQIYNYHPGRVMYYWVSGLPVPNAAAAADDATMAEDMGEADMADEDMSGDEDMGGDEEGSEG